MRDAEKYGIYSGNKKVQIESKHYFTRITFALLFSLLNVTLIHSIMIMFWIVPEGMSGRMGALGRLLCVRPSFVS